MGLRRLDRQREAIEDDAILMGELDVEIFDSSNFQPCSLGIIALSWGFAFEMRMVNSR